MLYYYYTIIYIYLRQRNVKKGILYAVIVLLCTLNIPSIIHKVLVVKQNCV